MLCSQYLQIIHLIFSWSTWLSWILFVFDLGLIAFLIMHAYQDGEWKTGKLTAMADFLLQQTAWIDWNCPSSEVLQAPLWTRNSRNVPHLQRDMYWY